MPLAPGARLGAYEILSLLGAGGMGEVYRARDTRLNRDVAIKVLPEAFVHDADRLARFKREAQVLASLNHPHIAAIYHIDDAPNPQPRILNPDQVQFLVLELVEGPTLADRIATGPIRVDEALPIARQIAEALEAAHEQGIIHRDLKPANIKLTSDGNVKVLDFGLAKALDMSAARDLNRTDISLSPTVTSPAMTMGGVILGTAAYMSPEQARGRIVDKRSDIWAFGCVVFEMLTGTRPFRADDVTDTIAFVITKDPDWSTLPPATPPSVHRLLLRCLVKDGRQRLHDIADARLEIDAAMTEQLQGEPLSQSASPVSAPRSFVITSAVVACFCLTIGMALGAIVWRRSSAASHVTHAMLDVSPATDLGTSSTLEMLPGGSRTALSWSPDGRTLAFVGSTTGVRQLFLRDLENDSARPVDGTQGLRDFTFSPDGEWIAFWTDGQIRKVRVDGGPTAKICDAATVNGISWGTTRLVYAGAPQFQFAVRQLFEVSADGGEPQLLTESSRRLASPFLLPGDSAVLYTEYEKVWTSGDERIVVRALQPGGESKVLVREAADPRYLASGHLTFLRQGTLFIAPFDAGTLRLAGAETAVLKGVAQAVASWAGSDLTLAGQLAVSPEGTLAYISSATPSLPTSELVKVDRNGRIMPLAAPPGTYRERIESSPNGASLAVSVQTTRSVRLYFYDRDRGTLTPPFADARDREAVRPVWSPDGKVALHVIHSGTSDLVIFRPDSPASPEPVKDSADFVPSGWFPAGDRLIGSKDGDLWVYSLNDERSSRWNQLTRTPVVESFPTWSPEGDWLAYVSNLSGRDEVYVQPYPIRGTPIAISTEGGRSPVWNPKGRELFYTEPHPQEKNDWRMISVDMALPHRPGKPVSLFSFSSENLLLATCNPTACYSVAPNGQEFFTLNMRPRQRARVTEIRLILNWFQQVKRLVPVK